MWLKADSPTITLPFVSTEEVLDLPLEALGSGEKVPDASRSLPPEWQPDATSLLHGELMGRTLVALWGLRPELAHAGLQFHLFQV